MEDLRRLRNQRGVSQRTVAEYLGISQQAYANYEAGKREPDYESLRRLSDYFGVSIDCLLGRSASASGQILSGEMPIRIPVLGTIPAGIPLEAIEDIVDYEELPTSMGRGGKEYFGLVVHGDSMFPEYRDGDVLILLKQDTCESGQDCAVMVNGGDATFKRVFISAKGISLQPINPAHEPMIFTRKEIASLPVRILGVVVEVRRKIRR